MRWRQFIVFGCCFAVVAFQASAREFLLSDLISGHKSLSSLQNNDEIVLNHGANPPVVLGPAISATQLTIRGPSAAGKSASTTPYVLFNTSIDVAKVTFKWINFTGTAPGADGTTIHKRHGSGNVYNVQIEHCSLYGDKKYTFLNLDDFYGSITITESEIVGYKQVLQSPEDRRVNSMLTAVSIVGNTISWRGGDWILLFVTESHASVSFTNNSMTWHNYIPGDSPSAPGNSKLLVGFAATVSVGANQILRSAAVPSLSPPEFQIVLNQISGQATFSQNDFTHIQQIEFAQVSESMPCFTTTLSQNRLSRDGISASPSHPTLRFMCDTKASSNILYTYNWWGEPSGPHGQQILAGASGGLSVPSAFPWYADSDMKHVAVKCGNCVFNSRCDYVTGQCSLSNETVTAIVVTVVVSIGVIIGVGICIWRKFFRQRNDTDEDDEYVPVLQHEEEDAGDSSYESRGLLGNGNRTSSRSYTPTN